MLLILSCVNLAVLAHTEIRAGYDALPELSAHPDNTIYNAKRFIGRRY